jgi:LPS-assembly lipoprotein
MSWQRSSVFVSLLCVLASCGFTPVYKQGKQQDALKAIMISSPDTREGQLLKAQLEDMLYPDGAAHSAAYRLDPNLQVIVEPLSIDADGTTRRYRIVGMVNYVLTDLATQKPLTKGSLQRFSSYHIASADYSTYVAGLDARKQVIGAIAEEVRLRMMDYFAARNDS